jgi:poly(A) polymerase/tRNA nucleotidyltransferase (CCA-adding enzyme)
MTIMLRDPDLAPILVALPQARLVGGCVRDMLAGRTVADIDLATPDRPEAVLAALAGAGLRAIPTGLAHGTVTAISGGRPFEITTLRRDEETDGRHARVTWTNDFTQDAARRDFTINAMSLDQQGTLHDPFGGAADLASGRVRFVGEPARRIAEDYLRVLRFFRFFARYGRKPADEAAVAAIRAAAALPEGGLRRLSAERVWSEFKRILAIPDPRDTLALMAGLGVLAAVLPEARDMASLAKLVSLGAPAEPLLRLAALVGRVPQGAAGRLKLSGAERERLEQLCTGAAPQAGDDAAALRRRLAEEPAEVLIGRSWLAAEAASLGTARQLLAAMQRPVFPLEGRDGLALGAEPGPKLGQALRRVRAWWLEGGCAATAEECRMKLAEEVRQ